VQLKVNKVAVAFLSLVFLSPLPHSYASWDPYENLRIALGNWTPTPIFKIESSNQIEGAYKYIKGDSSKIFTELEKKKAELLFLSTQIQQLTECKVTTCYKIVEDTNGLNTSTPFTNTEIDESLSKLIYEQKMLDKFIDYAEVKLLSELPKIKLALDVEILGGKSELKDFRNSIITMINSSEIKPLGKAQDYVEIKLSEAYPDNQFQNSFEFSGTINQIKAKLDEAKSKVSETFENLTGIRAVFSEFGTNISWDISNATSWVGITEETPKGQVDAYVALKELSVINYYAEKKIIDGALFKPIDQRTELENKVIQANTINLRNSLETMLKQRELTRMLGAQQLRELAPDLLAKRDDTLKSIESLTSDSQIPSEIKDKDILKLSEQVKNIDDALANFQRMAEGKTTSSDGGLTWYDGTTNEINERLNELRTLDPEKSNSEINSIVDRVNKSVSIELAENKLSRLQYELSQNTQAANDWQKSAVTEAQKNIVRTKEYWESRKSEVNEAINKITSEYISLGIDSKQARFDAESKYSGVLPQIQAQEKNQLDSATSWLESVSGDGLSEVAISKFGLDKTQDKINSVEQEIKSLSE
jgi:hypothetical protein